MRRPVPLRSPVNSGLQPLVFGLGAPRETGHDEDYQNRDGGGFGFGRSMDSLLRSRCSGRGGRKRQDPDGTRRLGASLLRDDSSSHRAGGRTANDLDRSFALVLGARSDRGQSSRGALHLSQLQEERSDRCREISAPGLGGSPIAAPNHAPRRRGRAEARPAASPRVAGANAHQAGQPPARHDEEARTALAAKHELPLGSRHSGRNSRSAEADPAAPLAARRGAGLRDRPVRSSSPTGGLAGAGDGAPAAGPRGRSDHLSGLRGDDRESATLRALPLGGRLRGAGAEERSFGGDLEGERNHAPRRRNAALPAGAIGTVHPGTVRKGLRSAPLRALSGTTRRAGGEETGRGRSGPQARGSAASTLVQPSGLRSVVPSETIGAGDASGVGPIDAHGVVSRRKTQKKRSGGERNPPVRATTVKPLTQEVGSEIVGPSGADPFMHETQRRSTQSANGSLGNRSRRKQTCRESRQGGLTQIGLLMEGVSTPRKRRAAHPAARLPCRRDDGGPRKSTPGGTARCDAGGLRPPTLYRTTLGGAADWRSWLLLPRLSAETPRRQWTRSFRGWVPGRLYRPAGAIATIGPASQAINQQERRRDGG